MAGTQALQLARTVAFSASAHDLTLVTDKDDRFYDHRVWEEIADDFILSIALEGVVQSIRAQQRGTDVVVIIGKQRTKACAVIDHLCGAHTYRGNLGPILKAIERLKSSDLGKRIVELVGSKGVRLTVQVLPPAGGAAKAQKVMAVENAHRLADSDAEVARKAQRMEVLGVPREEICVDLRVTPNKLGRLLKIDPDAPARAKVVKPKGPTRPGPKKLQAVRDKLASNDEDTAKGVWIGVRWALGEATKAEMLEVFPELAEALK